MHHSKHHKNLLRRSKQQSLSWNWATRYLANAIDVSRASIYVRLKNSSRSTLFEEVLARAEHSQGSSLDRKNVVHELSDARSFAGFGAIRCLKGQINLRCRCLLPRRGYHKVVGFVRFGRLMMRLIRCNYLSSKADKGTVERLGDHHRITLTYDAMKPQLVMESELSIRKGRTLVCR